MDMSGRADSAPTTLDDAAALIFDHEDEINSDPEFQDDPELDEDLETGTDPEAEEPEDEEPEDDAKPEQTSQKFKVTVQGEDGAEEVKEVSQQELIDGFMLKSRFTQLTQGLAERERQAAEVVQKNLAEGRQHYLQEAQKAQQAIYALAGLKSDHEMQQLAVQNPSEWVQERQRQEAIKGMLSEINQRSQAEIQRAQVEQEQQIQQMAQQSLAYLGKEGIGQPEVKGIFESFAKEYKLDMNQVSRTLDPRVVLAMRDAVKYRELKNKTTPVKKPTSGKVPAQRQSVPQQSQSTKRLEAKFHRPGGAKVRDLASFIMSNSK